LFFGVGKTENRSCRQQEMINYAPVKLC